MATALTIAGSDSGGGAGIQADLKTFAALGVYGTSAIAALTAQNTRGGDRHPRGPAAFVVAQIDAVADDIAIDAVKTGMLATRRDRRRGRVSHRPLELPHLVVDPVMVAKSGDRLLTEPAVEAIRRSLLPLAAVLTPNRPEAERLLGPERQQPRRREGRGAGGSSISAPRAVVIKGGHFDEADIVDLLYDGSTFHEFRHPRLQTRHTHGTGCTFAAAIAALLALGLPLPDAVHRATDYVAGAIAHGLAIGSGQGPLDHFWAVRPG